MLLRFREDFVRFDLIHPRSFWSRWLAGYKLVVMAEVIDIVNLWSGSPSFFAEYYVVGKYCYFDITAVNGLIQYRYKVLADRWHTLCNSHQAYDRWTKSAVTPSVNWKREGF